jgi:autotransporter-associated beta strand protein
MLARTRNSFTLSAAVAAAILSVANIGSAATITWTNAGSDFATGTNWSGGIPSGTNDALLANTYGGVTNQPSLAASAALNSLTFASALSPTQGYTVTNSSGSNSLTIGGAGAAFNLITRGLGATTFNGPTIAGVSALPAPPGNPVNIDVGAGTRLILEGDSKVTANQGNTTINGGTLVFDNTAINATDRFTTSGVIKLQGSGTLELIGNSAGGTYNIGSLNTVDNSDGGVNTIKVTPNTNAANTVLNFANSGTFTIRQGTRNVSVFEATTGELGSTNGPRITFTGTPFTGSGGLISNAAGNTAVGFAIVKDSLGTNFATYSTTAGVGIVSLASSAAKPASAVITTVTTAAQLQALTAAGTSSVGSNGQFNAPASTITLTGNSAAASLRISPAGAGGILAIGANNLLMPGLMLDGAFDYTVTGTGNPFSGTHYFYVNNPNTTLFYQPVLTTSGNQFTYAGPGFLELTGTVSQNLSNTARMNIAGGVLRANNTQMNFTNAGQGIITFGGGVLEIKNGANGSGASADFVRSLGTGGTGNVNWGAGTTAEQGSGGFSAFGAAASVNIGGNASPSALRWNQTNFVADGFALKFGSTKSNAVLNFLNPLQLDSTAATYQVREINVTAGVGGDKTVLQGVVSGASYADLLKTGAGTLELTQTNTYAGNTLIQNGTLKLTTASATNIAASPRIMAGLVSGSSAILDVSAVTNATGFEVQSGQTLGGHGTIKSTAVQTKINAGATIAPGSSIGTLTVDGGSFTLAGDAAFEITGNAALNTYDKIAGINNPNITYGGSLTVSFLATAPTAAGTYTLFSGFNGTSGAYTSISLPAAPSGLAWHDYDAGAGVNYFDYASGQIQLDVASVTITRKVSLTFNAADFSAPHRGDIVTAGSSSQYTSSILDLTNNGGNPGFETGNVKITGTLPSPDSDSKIWILIDSTGGDIDSLLSSLSVQTNLESFQTAITPTHQQFDEMAAIYAASGRTWDALLIFDASALDPSGAPGELAGLLNFNWDFTATGTAVDALVAVPEPASLSLIALGALGLLRRRR